MVEEPMPRQAQGVYGISVASELSGVAIQSLRLYEQRGLLAPSRTSGGTRRYSDDDIQRVQRITELVNNGVNLAGIAYILDLERRNEHLTDENARLRAKGPVAPRRTPAPRGNKKRKS